MAASFSVQAMVRGYHVYKDIWNAVDGETLGCRRETTNVHDPFSVTVVKDGTTVGHVPRKLSCLCSLFIRKHGILQCIVNGSRRHSSDLPQGGLEIPCIIKFIGEDKLINKAKMMFEVIESREKSNKKEESEYKGDNVEPKNKIIKVENSSDELEEKEEKKEREEKNKEEEKDEKGKKEEKDEKKKKEEKDEKKKKEDKDEKEKKQEKKKEDEIDWLRLGGLILKNCDKTALLEDKELNDKHIDMGQKLLKQQIRSLRGLLSAVTPLQVQPRWVNNYIQIFNRGGNHWITMSTIGCKEGEINMFDSLYSTVDKILNFKIGIVFPGIKCNIRPMIMRQQGVTDCGLFAIGVAVHLALGDSPDDIINLKFDQGKLRFFLFSCFEKKVMSKFPLLN